MEKKGRVKYENAYYAKVNLRELVILINFLHNSEILSQV